MKGIIFLILWAISILLIPKISFVIIKYKCFKENIEIPDFFSNKSYIFLGLILAFILYSIYYLDIELYLSFLAISLAEISIIVALIDLKINIIPNELLIVMFLIGFVNKITISGIGGLKNAFIGAFLMSLFFIISIVFFGTSKLGAGDVKLGIVAGFISSIQYLPTMLFMMALSIFTVCSIGLASRKLKRTDMIPFAGFIIFGMNVALLQSLIYLRG